MSNIFTLIIQLFQWVVNSLWNIRRLPTVSQWCPVEFSSISAHSSIIISKQRYWNHTPWISKRKNWNNNNNRIIIGKEYIYLCSERNTIINLWLWSRSITHCCDSSQSIHRPQATYQLYTLHLSSYNISHIERKNSFMRKVIKTENLLNER